MVCWGSHCASAIHLGLLLLLLVSVHDLNARIRSHGRIVRRLLLDWLKWLTIVVCSLSRLQSATSCWTVLNRRKQLIVPNIAIIALERATYTVFIRSDSSSLLLRPAALDLAVSSSWLDSLLFKALASRVYHSTAQILITTVGGQLA